MAEGSLLATVARKDWPPSRLLTWQLSVSVWRVEIGDEIAAEEVAASAVGESVGRFFDFDPDFTIVNDCSWRGGAKCPSLSRRLRKLRNQKEIQLRGRGAATELQGGRQCQLGVSRCPHPDPTRILSGSWTNNARDGCCTHVCVGNRVESGTQSNISSARKVGEGTSGTRQGDKV